MFKYSKLDYDKFYSSEHCRHENRAIARVLNSVCEDGDFVLDLGAGTGLVSALLEHDCFVYQVEKDVDMQTQNPYPRFIVSDALDYLRKYQDNSFDHVVSLFALNYMRGGVIKEALRVSQGACVFVLYRKPYIAGSDSIYAGKTLMFLARHWLRQRKIRREILDAIRDGYKLETFKLLGQPYYQVVILR